MARPARQAKQTSSSRKPKQSYLEVVGSDYRIPVPDDPAGERAAVAADPEFKRRLEAARREHEAGLTIPFDEAIAQLDAEFPLPRALPGKRRPKDAGT